MKTANSSEDPEALSYSPHSTCRQVFREAEKNALKHYILTASTSSSKIHIGFATKQAQELAYEFAVTNNKAFPEPWTKNKSATSLSPVTSFNHINISKFHNNLEEVFTKYKFCPVDIYNCDETGCSTVQKVGNEKVIASRNERQVGKVTSGERGVLVTFMCTIRAAGNTVPPFMVFPRVHFKQ